ncbi:MAG: hypothetical protein V4673_05775 [Pseudomonadota bacterium]
MSDIPKISAAGGDGSQVIGTSLVPSDAAPPLQAASVPDAIDGLIATHSRNLGGDVAARLLAASMRDTSNQLAAAHQKISDFQNELKEANIKITELRVEAAQLTARLREILGNNRVKQAATFVGTALLGLAVDLYKNALVAPASLLFIFGFCLLIFVVLPFGGRDNS